MTDANDKPEELTGRQQILHDFSHELAHRGRHIEAGWLAFCAMVIPDDAPEVQIDEMRTAFMAGAHLTFAMVTGIEGEGVVERPADPDRIRLMDAELQAFVREMDVGTELNAALDAAKDD